MSAVADKATKRAKLTNTRADHKAAARLHARTAKAAAAVGDADVAIRHAKRAKKHLAKVDTDSASEEPGEPNPLKLWADSFSDDEPKEVES